MSIGSVIANAAGIIEKAYIVFYDNRVTLDEYTTKDAENQAKATSIKGRSKAAAVSKKPGIIKGADAVLKGGGLSGATQLAASKGIGQNRQLESNDKQKVFRVQFNPSSISISTNVDDPDLRPTDSITNKEDMDKTTTVYSEFSVKLIFDDVDVEDAFTEQRLAQYIPGNYSNPIQTAYNLGKTFTGNNNRHTVRPQVEAFIGAARDKYLKSIAFIWADMTINGIIISVDADYTMFNPQGEPVRAVVDLKLVVDNSTETQDPLGPYRQSFDDVFSGSKRNYDAGSVTSKVGNMLHF